MLRARTDVIEQAQAIHAALQTFARTAPDAAVFAAPRTAFDLWAADTS